ncbi:MAG: RES family NAD+ phosphorylase [Deltaproteobacteria bacterium]|nr:RES family NAD+ phosphorylase [Deltaproteobacteria bacterium]
MPQYLRDRASSTEGSKLYGGRYNTKGAFGALYCGERPGVCSAELRKATAGRTLAPFVLASLRVKLQRVLDLTDRTVLRRLGVRSKDLVSPDWTLTQDLGRLAREAGFEALLVPSAAAPGRNLVIFPDHLDPASSVQLRAVKPVRI